MEHFGLVIDDKSRNAGGKQCIITPEGYTIPIHVRDGLPRMDMRIPTDAEMDNYPHVFITADSTWDQLESNIAGLIAQMAGRPTNPTLQSCHCLC